MKLNIKRYFDNKAIVATLVGVVMILLWDVLWCSNNTFRGMSFVGTYVNTLLIASLLALPTACGCRRGWQLALWLLAAGVMEANLMYARTYLTWIPLESYLLVGNVMDFTASIADSLRWVDLVMLIVPIGGFWLLRRVGNLKRAPYWITAAAAAAAAVVCSICYGGFPKHVNFLADQCYYGTQPPVIYTLAGTSLAEAMTASDTLSQADSLRVDLWLAEQRHRVDAYRSPVTEGRRNLVVIFCESFESWLIGTAVDNGKNVITPFLNEVVADSTTLYVPHVRSQVGPGRSIDGQLLTLAGMYPTTNSVFSMKRPDNTYHTVASAMKRRDGATRSYLLTVDKPITWNQGVIAPAMGIDTLVSRSCWRETEMVGNPPKLSDGQLAAQSVEKIKSGQLWEGDAPVYMQMLTYSMHNPFILQDELRRIHIREPRLPERLVDYMTVANYTDSALREIISYLKSRPDYAETMIVLVGDHEALGGYRKDWRGNKRVAELLSDEPEVPLIVLNSPVGGRIDLTIGQVDVYSTIIDLMGLRQYAWPGMGWSALAPRPADDDPHFADAPAISQLIIRYNLLAGR